MSPLLFLCAALAGGAGAVVRYLVDRGVTRLAGRRFPWGVFVINVTGSFALGVVVGLLPEVLFLVGAGFLGGYTTFSTAMLDTVALWRDGARRAAAGHAIGMLLIGVLAAGLGLAVASQF
ncbi:CrcB protein [Microbacterium keratanolyticum]|uniref:Fluoride-specific ion channel FluC n=1 Tax=Microbacterium keratanolyticum TaxID=67574 RepID=A0A9W6HPP2_9MICO|nr:CrcB family protein [Microbacterium keratanolyticum]MBM7468534.1 CrcB protein [Microbacterium keratanolyticum]GLK00611.1 putative fluoride ion transporter CrcB [Microbacterium keratanolyticum]